MILVDFVGECKYEKTFLSISWKYRIIWMRYIRI